MSSEKYVRPRKVCCDCGSLDLTKLVTVGLYKCRRCGWTGYAPDVRLAPCGLGRGSLADTKDRLSKLAEVHQTNPDISRIDLLRECNETDYMVDKYLASVREGSQ